MTHSKSVALRSEDKRVFSLTAMGTIATAIMLAWTTPHMTIAMIAYFLLLIGLQYRRSNQRVHAILMSSGIGLDIALVLLLQLNRDAVGTAMEFSLPILSQLHILFSSLALFLYFPILFLGFMRLKKRYTGKTSRQWHIRLGILAFSFRTIGLVLMFSLLEHFRAQAGG